VHAVTLTGSTAAGRSVASAAGQALKKTVLELGGSDAFVVLDDADLDAAAGGATDARLVNAGQSCIAAKRFIVVDAVHDAFVERLVAAMRARRVGNPLERTTQVGPLARRDLRDTLQKQVAVSIAAGARCLVGGTPMDGPGAFHPATVLVDVGPGMPAFDEETFGPVAAVIRARDETDAIRLANASVYGLGGAVWSRDRDRAERVAAAMETGFVSVNGQVRSDPRLPFGGVKQSGYGRELAEYGLREFVNVKTVVVR
jgi:succinate-semialdehyde dehydrogenase/glutarate-semialdehyde dehydrogenase